MIHKLFRMQLYHFYAAAEGQQQTTARICSSDSIRTRYLKSVFQD